VSDVMTSVVEIFFGSLDSDMLFKSCEVNNDNFIQKVSTLLYSSLTSQHFHCILLFGTFKCPQKSVKARSHTHLACSK
jgi:hypothetical protein